MNRTVLAERVANNFELQKNTADAIISDIFETIITELEKGRKVSLKNFGTFTVVQAQARTGRNPNTGEAVPIPAKKRVKYTASKRLKALPLK
jgi:DNA-binding protein HU-beta